MSESLKGKAHFNKKVAALRSKKPIELTIGERMLLLRLDNGFNSQKKFADWLAVSKSVVGKYENGEAQLTLEIIRKLSKEFSVSFDYLLGNSNSETNEHHDIGELTGLSKTAIKKLKSYIPRPINKEEAEAKTKEKTKNEKIIASKTIKLEERQKNNRPGTESLKSIIAILKAENESIDKDTEERLEDERRKKVRIAALNAILESKYCNDFLLTLGACLADKLLFDNDVLVNIEGTKTRLEINELRQVFPLRILLMLEQIKEEKGKVMNNASKN